MMKGLISGHGVSYSVRCFSSKSTKMGSVMLSRDRLDQLLQSEISHFALKQARPFTLKEIISHRNRDKFTTFLYDELPVRFATRIKLLESIKNFETEPFLLHTRNLYVESFKQMRMADSGQVEDFTMMLKNLKKRHANVIPLLITGIRELRSRYSDTLTVAYVDNFLNNFFLSRIGTEMLTSQFLQMDEKLNPDGIMQKDGDPLQIILQAAEAAEKLCHHHYGFAPGVVIWSKDVRNVAYISNYLYYIVFELFKVCLSEVGSVKQIQLE
eukprot:GHVN01048569.1.p1 GENE.GHVN01048569.1~~GHVN01048569.1.p1  ORF type:complete len:269 (+),score=21.91 GHVN01048569.1:35-841(+)